MIRVLILTICIGFSSCLSGVEETPRPDNLLEKDKMVQVIKELVKIESHIQSTYPTVSEFNKVMVNSSDTLFNQLGITKSEFESSMDYYGAHQEEMYVIYNEALDLLNNELGELEESEP